MTRIAWLLPAAALLACKSSAAYTVPSAVINTALAVGVSAQERAAGGCYAVCAYGTVCDPSSGFCVKEASRCGTACQSWELCIETDGASWRCVPSNSVISAERVPVGNAPGQVAPGVGVSPATGSAPTLPIVPKKPDAP
jgi:hypothetical protein